MTGSGIKPSLQSVQVGWSQYSASPCHSCPSVIWPLVPAPRSDSRGGRHAALSVQKPGTPSCADGIRVAWSSVLSSFKSHVRETQQSEASSFPVSPRRQAAYRGASRCAALRSKHLDFRPSRLSRRPWACLQTHPSRAPAPPPPLSRRSGPPPPAAPRSTPPWWTTPPPSPSSPSTTSASATGRTSTAVRTSGQQRSRLRVDNTEPEITPSPQPLPRPQRLEAPPPSLAPPSIGRTPPNAACPPPPAAAVEVAKAVNQSGILQLIAPPAGGNASGGAPPPASLPKVDNKARGSPAAGLPAPQPLRSASVAGRHSGAGARA